MIEILLFIIVAILLFGGAAVLTALGGILGFILAAIVLIAIATYLKIPADYAPYIVGGFVVLLLAMGPIASFALRMREKRLEREASERMKKLVAIRLPTDPLNEPITTLSATATADFKNFSDAYLRDAIQGLVASGLAPNTSPLKDMIADLDARRRQKEQRD